MSINIENNLDSSNNNSINNSNNNSNDNLNNNNSNEKYIKKIIKVDNHSEWSQDHEKVLVEWADKAMCYRWLHNKSNEKYNTMTTYFTIPVIILSTVTGTASFAQERLPTEYQGYAQMIIGSLSIFAGILTTIQQFLKVNELNESHRMCSINWDKFYRDVKTELSQAPAERANPTDMLKNYKKEFDRLMEISPNIDNDIIEEFKKTFTQNKERLEIMHDITKPEILDELTPTDAFRHKWYLEKPQEILIEMNNINYEEEKRMKDENNLQEEAQKILGKFKDDFIKLYKREPLQSEMIDNLKNEYNNKFLDELLNFKENNISNV